MRLARLAVTLTLEGPVLSRATEPGPPGLDSPVARDPKRHPMLPFSLVQGRLRQAWEEIGEVLGVGTERLDELLGKASGDEQGDWSPHQGRLLVSDFVAEEEGGSQVDTSVSLDGERRAAKDGALRHLEVPFLPGKPVAFHGEVRFLARGEAEARAVAEQVEQGLRWVPFYGSERTVGFGRAVAVAAKLQPEPVSSPTRDAATAAERLPLALLFKSPFCIARRPEGGNLFEGSEVVPGGALKGTLARMIRELFGLGRGAEIAGDLPAPYAELGRTFSALRFTHAFPARSGQARPTAIPSSTVAVKEGETTAWYDVALCPSPVVIDGQAPAFAVDWKRKQESDIRERFGWPAVDRELRLRTAIDREQRRAADEKLFGYEAVRPEGLVWRSAIDLADVPEAERPAVAAQLRALLALGFQAVGKTGAEAAVTFDPTEPQPAALAPLVDRGGRRVWVVTLQTPALLADPAKLGEGAGDRELFSAYAAAWQKLGEAAGLTLLRFLSQERLVGGYQTQRFRKARGGGAETSYRPYLLSEAGSVFVLRSTKEDEAAKLLASWVRRGLPLPEWAKTRYGDTWRTNPFTRQDGYGEIAVNHPWHTENPLTNVEELPWLAPSAT